MPSTRANAAVIGAVVAAFLPLLLGVPPASAADGAAAADVASNDTVTWAVRPSDGVAADGRTRIEVEIDPGQRVVDHLIVTNLGEVPARFGLNAADGYFTEQGRFTMMAAGEESVDAGTWIEMSPPTVQLEPGASAVAQIEISVPENATPGDHPAGIAAALDSTAQAADGSTLGVQSRVGFRVMTRVTGDLAPALALSGLTAHYELSWNPFAPGFVELTYTAGNEGNTRLGLQRNATAAGHEADDDGAEVELFPGDRRELAARVDGVWPLGFTTVRVDVTGDVLPEPGSIAPAGAASEIVVWAVPWPQLVVLAGIGLLVFAMVSGRRRRRAGIERLIAEARAEGARQAPAETTAGRA